MCYLVLPSAFHILNSFTLPARWGRYCYSRFRGTEACTNLSLKQPASGRADSTLGSRALEFVPNHPSAASHEEECFLVAHKFTNILRDVILKIARNVLKVLCLGILVAEMCVSTRHAVGWRDLVMSHFTWDKELALLVHLTHQGPEDRDPGAAQDMGGASLTIES